ncbi:MAG: nitroreductase family protein [Lentisphaerae bacterium]|nr:nitroreductase family protein [Lentisphaerota bacterium]
MKIEELIKSNRSCRRFNESESVSFEQMRDLVNLARLSPSAGNLQPLRFVISCTGETNDLIFPNLAWAGYLTGWDGPVEGERPAAYIVILGDTRLSPNFGCDHGIAAQSILLGARANGLAGCILGALDRKGLRASLKVPETHEILLVIALGVPAEEVQVEDMDKVGSVKYWRDADGRHHVPKRPLDQMALTIPLNLE